VEARSLERTDADIRNRYDTLSAALHWLTAGLVISAIVIALWADRAGRDLGLQLIFLHKSLGLTIFAVVVVRIGWRLFHRAPPYSLPLPMWQRIVSWIVHYSLYALMLALPITGYLLSTKSMFPLEWFGNEIPKAPVSDETAEAADAAHGWLSWVAIWMVVLHVSAALWHQFGMRDRLIARMNPFST